MTKSIFDCISTRIATQAVVCLTILSSFSDVHEHYVSITTVEYNSKSRALEIAIQLTGHDVELAVQKMGYGELKLGAENESKIADNILFKYAKQHFGITVGDAPQTFYWIGKEIGADDMLWIYIEVQGIAKPNSLSVYNKLLLEHFPRQQNITHVKIGNSIQSATFDVRMHEKAFNFQ